VALGPDALASLADAESGLPPRELSGILVDRIRGDVATEAAVRHALERELSEPPARCQTVAVFGSRLRAAVRDSDHRAAAAVTWTAATAPGLAWRRLEERAREALVLMALWALGAQGDGRLTVLAAK
jgi:hypothetical protein